MKIVLAHQMQEGKAYRSPEGDLLLVTRVAASSTVGRQDISFVWLGSADEELARCYLGQEHEFTAGPGDAWKYEEL